MSIELLPTLPAGPAATAFRLALTYDDVLLVPRRSSVRSRSEVSTSSRLTRRLTLAAPVVAANMETVTEAPMAIAMARAGGLGVIHRFLPVAHQAAMVERVKRAENLIIRDPYRIGEDATVGEARGLMREKGVRSLLVVGRDDGRLAGILTARDLRLDPADDEPIARYATRRDQLVTAPPDVTLEEARLTLHRHRIEKLPLIDADGVPVGLVTVQDLVALRERPHASKDVRGRLLVGAAIGVRGDYLERAAALIDAGVDVLVLDIAHGHAEHALAALERLRGDHPDIDLVAGNVATAAGADDLCRAGADAVKVGVGPGSACTTRIVAGVGVPQLTAVMDAVAACRPHDVPVIADGGIREPGDMAKAIAAGAECVMVGNLLAGTDESPGTVVTRGGRKVKVYRGMASAAATQRRMAAEGIEPPAGTLFASVRSAGADVDLAGHAVPEGVEATVPYRESATAIVANLVGGLRSSMSYADARTVAEFHENAEFVRITQAGLLESRPHDLDL
ncbi:MAG: Inosine-5'-monophosphate dehydrogenase / CBS domain [uncultured Thermoleophilia bacterium]|uniref:Inosine-5'-monophosphate dehydrogenase n=1 Tax=uncultured Thermoleophilia bacterium TaxID=1497501 RepID=A0A6J4UC40_9ACTN|nr:MAG: Inosine-5'-monophosphate dehydrogenase / CBS domain [uncultured Thermoleophilia bacterium]